MVIVIENEASCGWKWSDVTKLSPSVGSSCEAGVEFRLGMIVCGQGRS